MLLHCQLLPTIYGMVKFLLGSLLVFVSFSSIAQLNDSVHYHLKYFSSGVINKTQETNSYVLNNALNFNVQHTKIGYNAMLGWVYGAQKKVITNNDFTGHADIDFLKKGKKLYYWGLVNFDKSYSLNINYRLQAGAGVAYNFIDSPSLKINVSDGFIYEKGDLIDVVRGRDVYQIPRNSFRLSYRWDLLNVVHIEGIHFYQPSLLAINDYIIQSTNSLSIRLKKWLSINGTLIYNKVSRTQRDNLLITYGLTVEKYF